MSYSFCYLGCYLNIELVCSFAYTIGLKYLWGYGGECTTYTTSKLLAMLPTDPATTLNAAGNSSSTGDAATTATTLWGIDTCHGLVVWLFVWSSPSLSLSLSLFYYLLCAEFSTLMQCGVGTGLPVWVPVSLCRKVWSGVKARHTSTFGLGGRKTVYRLKQQTVTLLLLPSLCFGCFWWCDW